MILVVFQSLLYRLKLLILLKAERSRKKAGFIAQELEEVFPESCIYFA
ncbi:tail fiber domain-containing protein [Bacteroides salyersiae]|nr:tail fiber domain-containing protein [Bacteroides salyersiae]